MRVHLTFARVTATLVTLFAAASSLTAQERPLTNRFPASKSAARLDVVMDSLPRGTADRLISLLDSATKESLPTEPMLLRMLEGNAKNAAPDKIIANVSRLRVNLQHARQLLGPKANMTEVTLAADVLQAGVSDERLMQLHGLRGKQTMTAPLNAFLNLVSRGAVPDLAWDHIADLAKQKAGDADFGRLTPSDLTSKLNKGRP